MSRPQSVLAVVLKSNFPAQPQLGYAELRQVQAKTIEKVKVFWPSALKRESAAVNSVKMYERL